MFADLCAVSRPYHDDEEPGSDLLQSPQEQLHAWLRSFDAEAEKLPHGSSTSCGGRWRTTASTASNGRWRSRRRATGFSSPSSVPMSRAPRSSAILDRRLEDADELAGTLNDSHGAGSGEAGGRAGVQGDGGEFREVLDRLVAALEGRDPVVADLAREVRFRYFDEPVIAEAREQVYAKIEQRVVALTSDPQRPDAEALIREIVDCPRPIAPR